MAQIARTLEVLETFKDKVHIATWETLTESDTADAVELPGSPDRSIQVLGDFGTGGMLTVQGSNDGVTWATLNDPQGTALVIGAAGIYAIQELTRYIRPAVTAGTSVDLDVVMLLRRP